MKYVKFGTSESQASEIILGLMRISSMNAGKVEYLVDSALAQGINFLDTADCYANGYCETLLGEVLQKRPDLRQKVLIQSKCGIRVDPDFVWYDFSKEHILNSVDGILSRLKTDHLDSLLLHRPDALMEADEIAEAFNRLHEQGKVLNFGVSNQNPMMMEKLRRSVSFPLAANQIQLSCAFSPTITSGFTVNMYWDGAVMRDGGILEYCQMNDIAVQSWSSLQYGFFDGVFIGSDKYPELNSVLNRIAAEKNVSATAVALAWILRYPAKMQAVIGTTRVDRVVVAAKASDIELSRKEWYEIYIKAGNRLP